MNPKYLVRPNDFTIFEIDNSNNCYHPSTNINTLPSAMPHFTYKNLTKNYGFFPIKESEISFYKEKSEEYFKFLIWQSRSDGHGGCKGGTYEEYIKK